MDGLRKIVAGLVAIAAGVLYATHSHAAMSMIGKGQVPGHYRVVLGDFEAVPPGGGAPGLPVVKVLAGATTAHVGLHLMRPFLADLVATAVDAHLVNTGIGHLRAEGGGHVDMSGNDSVPC
jgi:hypothetical protein